MDSKDFKMVTLSNGIQMPRLGLGVMFIEEGQEMQNAIDTAIDTGYRLFDNAALYENEAAVGKALKNNGIKREEVFISSKLRNSEQKYEKALKAFDLSMKTLGLDYLDMYLIHWPCPEHDTYCEAWKALEHLYKEGYVRAIGLSNFQENHIDKIFGMCEIPPVINQLECNPYLTIEPLRKYCHDHGIWSEAWFPLGGPAQPLEGEPLPEEERLLNNPVLKEISEKYNKTVAQIVLRWEVQSDIITIPKSSKPHRIKENIDIFDFCLSRDEMQKINSLNRDLRIGPDPQTFNLLF